MDLLRDTLNSVHQLQEPSDKYEARVLEAFVFGTRVCSRQPFSAKIYTSYGVFDNGSIVATSRVNHRPLLLWRKDENFAVIKALDPEVAISATAVHPEHRGKGYGRALRARLQEDFRSILTGSGSKSDPSIVHLNETQGFRLVFKRGPVSTWFWTRSCGNVEMSAGAER